MHQTCRFARRGCTRLARRVPVVYQLPVLSIHPTAIVSDEAVIAAEAEIGPYCVIGGRVRIGAYTVLDSHVRVGSRFGEVIIGEHNYLQAGVALGGPPQDLSHDDAYTKLLVGDHNRFGEFATVSLGSSSGGGVTRLGNRCFLMAYVHVGHDCQIADEVVITNLTQLAGHMVVERNVVISGAVGCTQFIRLGEYSFLTAGARVNKDIAPYAIADGHWATMRATNRVGLKRAGFDAGEIRNIDRAMRSLLNNTLTVEDALQKIEEDCTRSPQIEHLVSFVRESEKGIARG